MFVAKLRISNRTNWIRWSSCQYPFRNTHASRYLLQHKTYENFDTAVAASASLARSISPLFFLLFSLYFFLLHHYATFGQRARTRTLDEPFIPFGNKLPAGFLRCGGRGHAWQLCSLTVGRIGVRTRCYKLV